MRTFLVTICTLFMLTISSCNKCGHKIEKVYRIFNYADYFDYFFKENSIWIYQNTSTLALDTVIVQNAYVTDVYELMDKDECKNIYENKAEMVLHTTYFDTIFKHVLKYYGIGTNPHFFYDYTYYDYIYTSNLKVVGDENIGLFYEDYFEEYTIGTSKYYKIKKIKNSVTDQFGYNVLYWCPKIGIVKKELVVNSLVIDTWELIYSNVKQ
jgi:hypothetical protein